MSAFMLQQQLKILRLHKESKHRGLRYPCEGCEYEATRADVPMKLKKNVNYACNLCS